MKLSALLKVVAVKALFGPEEGDIESIHYDSRKVTPGGLFVAIQGWRMDGHDYIDHAVGRGAVAVVAERVRTVPAGVSLILVANARQALADLASMFNGNPSRELFVIGITGTNGKTTTAYLTESILKAAGLKVGVIGTINTRYGNVTFPNPVTTPESLDLMAILRRMADSGITHAVLEVSSHALDMGRVSCCHFDVGVFTNLTRDHLDYHKDMETYWACKKALCTGCLGEGPKRGHAAAVINVDDPKGKELAGDVTVTVFTVGMNETCHVRAEEVRIGLAGTSALVCTPEGDLQITSALVGRHNVHNILAATGIALAAGLPLASIKEGIENLRGVPGRLEPVPNEAGLFVFVDYAHTPDAIENVLGALRGLTAGRLITIFGCGGDRDRAKRPMMGAAAARLSDLAVVTSDNPRSEAPEAILADIVAGTAGVAKRRYEAQELELGFDAPGYTVEVDRRRAIALGIGAARPGDTVVIAGKGHETYQILGDRTVAFDDRVEARAALEALRAAH